ncbi:MAG TPA: protein-glutamate O-methyltransferase CheR, partial [Solimonas sp.]|nr:protein-glutamate O-methyltransferase CheR [Solimonas sp.]
MALPEIEQLLKKAMGLDSQSIGSPTVERAVESRQRALRIADAQVYWDKVSTDEAELQELIEAVVVPETWFFRDREAFAALAGTVLPEWLRSHPGGVMRLLSLPCSSGEEPFSIAMALLDAGLAPERFAIDAVDISARALEIAQRGLYSPNSFRGEVLGFRDRHFEPTPHGHKVSDAVRQQVRFRQGNIFSPNAGELYDVVFCRNLLIYFDRPVQDRAVKVIEKMLTAKGFLFVGPSETSLLGSHNFTSARWPLAFAFRKGVVPVAKPAAPPRAAARPAPRPAPKPVR